MLGSRDAAHAGVDLGILGVVRPSSEPASARSPAARSVHCVKSGAQRRQAVIFEFDHFELDDDLLELRRTGTLVPLQPKVLKLILHLVRHGARVVTKEELGQLLWPQQRVGATSLTRAAHGARLALDDSGESQRAIRTVRCFGYRFCLPVRERAGQVPCATRRSSIGELVRAESVVLQREVTAGDFARHRSPEVGGGQRA